jgi:hypothetical protein
MLKAISNLWRVARGTELFKQVDEIASKSIPALQGQALTRLIATVRIEMPALRKKQAISLTFRRMEESESRALYFQKQGSALISTSVVGPPWH